MSRIPPNRYFAAIAVSVGKLQSHCEIVGTTKRIADIIQESAITAKIPRIHDFTSVARREVYFASVNFLFDDVSSPFKIRF